MRLSLFKGCTTMTINGHTKKTMKQFIWPIMSWGIDIVSTISTVSKKKDISAVQEVSLRLHCSF